MWQEGQPIFLISCSAGGSIPILSLFIDNPAQALADQLQVPVFANHEDIATSTGHYNGHARIIMTPVDAAATV